MSWETINLGDAATFVNGYAFKPSDWGRDGKEIIRIQNLTGRGNDVNYYDGELSDRYKVICGDLLISWSATLGIFEWEREDAWLNQHIFKVVFDKKEFDKSFFKHLINSVLTTLEQRVYGSTMKHITKGNFDKTRIVYPPLPEQKRIADMLDKADALRKKNKELLAAYDELLKATFLDMFGDPTSGNVSPLKYSIKVLGGYAFKSTDFVNEGVPVIKIGTVNKGYFDLKSVSYMPFQDVSKYTKWKIFPGDILISLTGTVGKDDYANAELATDEYDFYLLNQRVAKIEISEDLDKMYVYFLFKQPQIKDALTKNSRGVRQANISNNDILNLQVEIPSISRQRKFGKVAENIEAQKALVKQSLQESEDLFNGLVQKAFKGELTK